MIFNSVVNFNYHLYKDIPKFFFIFLMLTLSPNYIMQIYPSMKILWVFFFAIFFLLILMNIRFIRLNQSGYLFLSFYLILIITSIVNFFRIDNLAGINFSITIFLKFIIIFLFIMSLRILDFIKTFKIIIYFMLVICIFSILGWLLYAFSFISVTNNIIIDTYSYNILSFWGMFTVSFPLGGFSLIRNQFFFQEPGFFAFYIFCTMFFLFSLKNFFTNKFFYFSFFIFVICMLTTLSLTGIFLTIVLSLFLLRNKVLNTFFIFSCVAIILYIFMADNPYVNKEDSFFERMYGLEKGMEVFANNPLNLLIGSGYNAEIFYNFDGKFNNFILEILFYSGLINLIIFFLFLVKIIRLNIKIVFPFLLILSFCATTPLFWSPIMFLVFAFMMRNIELRKTSIL